MHLCVHTSINFYIKGKKYGKGNFSSSINTNRDYFIYWINKILLNVFRHTTFKCIISSNIHRNILREVGVYYYSCFGEKLKIKEVTG